MSNLSVFSQSTALSIYQSDEKFPVDLDEAWQWLGYSRKDPCLDAIEKALVENVDFSRSCRKSTGGRPRQDVRLSIEGFKSLGMFSQTEQGKVIRKYFLQCEHIAKRAIANPQTLLPPSNTKLTQLTADRDAIQHRIKELKHSLSIEESKLQQVSEALIKEAELFKAAYPEVMKQSLLCDEILRKAQDNPFYPFRSKC
ncbi:hypothetical protein [Nostoc sp.]|uniref:hypothetical protein n=1 Tax=Nostoc sp. TaxID=1180 RepID=UPI002FFAB9D7